MLGQQTVTLVHTEEARNAKFDSIHQNYLSCLEVREHTMMH